MVYAIFFETLAVERFSLAEMTFNDTQGQRRSRSPLKQRLN